jgi:hypothetical protein
MRTLSDSGGKATAEARRRLDASSGVALSLATRGWPRPAGSRSSKTFALKGRMSVMSASATRARAWPSSPAKRASARWRASKARTRSPLLASSRAEPNTSTMSETVEPRLSITLPQSPCEAPSTMAATPSTVPKAPETCITRPSATCVTVAPVPAARTSAPPPVVRRTATRPSALSASICGSERAVSSPNCMAAPPAYRA